MVAVASVVADRVLRPVPPGLGVLPGSLPVVSFGDPGVAAVATVSLNPSWLEFQSPSGEWLLGSKRRLASLVSMDVIEPSDLDEQQVGQVVAESYAYFQSGNWYRSWFGWLERLLRDSGAGSYLDGSACHLDLVQWATKPAQRGLPPATWQQLVNEDRAFLRWQLASGNVSVVLVNGASVAQGLVAAGLMRGLREDTLADQANRGVGRLRVFRAVSDGVLFLGWNRPLAGPLPSDARNRLAAWVASALETTPGSAGVSPGAAWPRSWTTGGSSRDGHIPAGTVAASVVELEQLLAHWAKTSKQPTIGDIGVYGGAPLITVQAALGKFILNRDTKRAAVLAFLNAAACAGGARNLHWHLAPNARGAANRVSYRGDDDPTPGWYAYLRSRASHGSVHRER